MRVQVIDKKRSQRTKAENELVSAVTKLFALTDSFGLDTTACYIGGGLHSALMESVYQKMKGNGGTEAELYDDESNEYSDVVVDSTAIYIKELIKELLLYI